MREWEGGLKEKKRQNNINPSIYKYKHSLHIIL
jgi:hypothetical protein